MEAGQYSSEDLLDINFVKLIAPIYAIQLVLGSSSVVIRGNLVSTIKNYQKVYSILWIIVVSGSFYCFQMTYYNSYYNKDKTLYYTFAFGWLLQYMSYLFNIFHARFLKSKETVAVFLKIQKIDYDLKKYNLSSLHYGNYYMNRMWICYILVSFGGGFLLYVYYNIENYVYTIPMGCAILALYLELVFTGSCIYYLALRLQYLNTIAEKIFQNGGYTRNNIRNIKDMDRVLTITVGEANESITLKDFTNILTSILKLFQDTSNLFAFEIFNVVVTVFIWTFLVIESTVVGLNNKLLSTLTSVILIIWMLFYLGQVTMVAYACDWFAKKVRDTKRLAIHAMSVCCEDTDADIRVRQASWELLQLIEFEKPIFSVYGVFNLNMRLPLQLISVITTNVLVLIQYTSNALNTN